MAAAAGLFVLRSFYIFYPVLGLAVLLALVLAARKLRRPHY